MGELTLKMRVSRRAVLLLLAASLSSLLPFGGRHGLEARADDDGGGGPGGDGGDSRDGGDDGGSDDNGDDGGDDGGSDGNDGADGNDGGGGSGNGRGGSGSQGAKGGGQPAGGSASQRDGALAKRLKGRIAPINEIEAIAGKAVPGEIIDVRLYRNKDLYVYRVKIIQRGGSIYDVRIDAVTRKVLSARER